MKLPVEELFHAVADLSARGRAEYFAERCVEESVRKEVEALIAFDAGGITGLERDIGEVAEGALTRFDEKTIRCGPYQLSSLLGRGGMGTVHLAERVDGEVKQRVAVKLLHAHAGEPWVRERFLAERQILAMLSHPHIARLLDAGHREDGQPYLVMEYVDGKAIDEYARKLSVRERVALMVKVCGAVGHLHRNLVVHRDLKPSNILVTEDGEPKLLDFGIAKMLAWSGEATATGMRVMTPDYASPEQVEGSGMTTATDIYSLGAVLYKLLTGVSPHRFEEATAGAIAKAITSGRITAPSRLTPGLKGDLESILMKALRREPQERYATIEQLAEDLENYLESRPVRARRGDAWYQARKFVRRYWLPVGAGSLALAGLAGGAVVANHERVIAERRFVQVRQLANRLFDIDAEVRKTPGTTKARHMIVGTSLEYLRRLAGDVQGDMDLALELGNAYLRVARLQGVPITSNLGLADEAERSLQTAEGLLEQVRRARPGDRVAMLRSAQVAHDRMVLAGDRGAKEEALAFARESAKWIKAYDRSGRVEKSEADGVAIVFMNVAGRFVIAEEYDEGLRLSQRAAEVARAAGIEPQAGAALMSVADAHRKKGELEEALKAIQESARILEPGGTGSRGRNIAYLTALTREGQILGEDEGISMGRREDGAAVLKRAYALAEKMAQEDENDADSRSRAALAGRLLAGIVRHRDARRALEYYDHALKRLAEIANTRKARRQEVRVLAESSHALRRLGRFGEARQRLEQALGKLEKLKLYPAERLEAGSEASEALCAMADWELENGRAERAAEIYEEVLGKVMASGPRAGTSLADAVYVSQLYEGLAAARRRVGDRKGAAEDADRRVALWKQWDTRMEGNEFVKRQVRAAREAARWGEAGGN